MKRRLPRAHFVSRALNTTEDAEQTIVCDWLRARGLFFFSVPNEAAMKALNKKGAKAHQRGSAFGLYQKLVNMGLLPGAPDLVVINQFGGVIFLEMKRNASANVNDNQKKVHADLKKLGHEVIVGYGYDDAISKLEEAGC